MQTVLLALSQHSHIYMLYMLLYFTNPAVFFAIASSAAEIS